MPPDPDRIDPGTGANGIRPIGDPAGACLGGPRPGRHPRRRLLGGGPQERWALLGPNGSGKTTLLNVVGAALWPTRGVVEILGERLGRVDMRELRKRIAVVSASVARTLRPAIPALDVVLTGRYAALETWWHEYTDEDRDLAGRLLDQAGFGGERLRDASLRVAVRG